MHRPGGSARRGFVVPALWAAAIEARRAEFDREGERSRERWRADEVSRWTNDLLAAVERVEYSHDPAQALAGVVAVAAAWHDAMTDPGRAPAAIGG